MALGLAALAFSTAACLPRGAPPGGTQVVADRQATLEAIVPPNGDGELENATFNNQVYKISEVYPGQLVQKSYQIVLPSIGVHAEF